MILNKILTCDVEVVHVLVFTIEFLRYVLNVVFYKMCSKY